MDLLASDTNALTSLAFYWDAYARINNARQIIAHGWNGSGLHPVLLRPLPRAANLAPVAGNDTVTNHGGSLVVPIATLLAARRPLHPLRWLLA